MDHLFAPLDIYCERVDASFWSEPVNALTNIFMVAAGIYGLVLVRAARTGTFAEVLCWWVCVIGAGSFLFHTTAIELTKWADIVPIGVFTLVMSWFAMRRFAGLSRMRSLAYLVSYFAAIGVVAWLLPAWVHEASNGTTIYLPALGAFVFCGVVALARGGRGGWYALVCAGVLLVAFIFRAADQDVCAAFPLGTHFMWHTLIGLMLAINLVGVAKYGAPRPES